MSTSGSGASPRSNQPPPPVSPTPAMAALAEAPTVPPPPPAPAAGAGGAQTVVGASERRIGSYTLRRLIGEGGMGAVYEAEQDNPRRIVALKVMRSGIASELAIRRFEYEAQLLARLRHPGIAQIFEAGTHTATHAPALPGAAPHVTPYYAMEYIPGARTLTTYAQAAGLDMRRRMELFAKVCDAVHHGHTKGVIHRDLKPANILVDASGEPKVIDFGVARAADPDLSGPTMYTQPGVMVGTPQYMSPEQVAGEADIDTRSDVYALGVVLYELLSGELPYDLGTSSAAGELTRIIREQPARRLSLATRSQVRGDAETIVHKALEKDRERRYQSAADLAADLRRFLNSEPIAARRPSVAYQLRVMARRNRALAIGAGVGVVALAAAAVISTVFGVEAAAGRREAVAAQAKATQEAARARRVTDFLSQMLATADPHNSQSHDVTVHELLDEAAGRIPQAFKDDPDVEGELRVTLGKTYFHLGELAGARAQFEAAHKTWLTSRGENDPETLNALALTGAAVMMQGKPDQAETILRDALARQTVAVGEDHADTLATLSNLALVMQDLGRFDEAEKLLRRSIEAKTRTLGPVHDETLTSRMSLSDLLQSQGKIDEAVRVGQETAQACERALGGRHPSTLTAQSILASAIYDAGRTEEAATLLKKVYDTRVEVLGADHPDTLTTLNTLALNQEQMGQLDQAEANFRKLLKGATAASGAEHPATLTYASNLAMFLSKRADSRPADDPRRAAEVDEAERLLRETIAAREKRGEEETTGMLSARNNLAMVLENRGMFAEAEPIYRKVVEGADQSLPVDHWMRFAARKNLADCLVDLGRSSEAEPMLIQAYADLKRVLGEQHQRTRSCAKSLGRLYERAGKVEDAARWNALSVAAPAAGK